MYQNQKDAKDFKDNKSIAEDYVKIDSDFQCGNVCRVFVKNNCNSNSNNNISSNNMAINNNTTNNTLTQ